MTDTKMASSPRWLPLESNPDVSDLAYTIQLIAQYDYHQSIIIKSFQGIKNGQ